MNASDPDAGSSSTSAGGSGRQWQSQPEVDDDAVREATGRTWDQWCDRIDQWPGRDEGHAAIAAQLEAEHGVGDWWAQCVTVGYERITGRRLPFQRPDGTFSVSRSRKMPVDAAVLRESLLSDESRRKLFPGRQVQLRSWPTAKMIRIEIGPGVAGISITPAADDTARVAVEHQKLSAAADVPVWQEYWTQWLAGLPDAVARAAKGG